MYVAGSRHSGEGFTTEVGKEEWSLLTAIAKYPRFGSLCVDLFFPFWRLGGLLWRFQWLHCQWWSSSWQADGRPSQYTISYRVQLVHCLVLSPGRSVWHLLLCVQLLHNDCDQGGIWPEHWWEPQARSLPQGVMKRQAQDVGTSSHLGCLESCFQVQSLNSQSLKILLVVC